MITAFILVLTLMTETDKKYTVSYEKRNEPFVTKKDCIDYLSAQYLEENIMYRIIDRNSRYGFYECRETIMTIK